MLSTLSVGDEDSFDSPAFASKALLAFLRQTLGISADLITVSSINSTTERYGDQFLRPTNRLPQSPVRLLLLVLICVMDVDNIHKPTSKSGNISGNLDSNRDLNSSPDRANIADFSSPSPVTGQQNTREDRESDEPSHVYIQQQQKRIDLAQEYILRQVMSLCACFPNNVTDLTMKKDHHFNRKFATQTGMGQPANEMKRKILDSLSSLHVVISVLGLLSRSRSHSSNDGS